MRLLDLDGVYVGRACQQLPWSLVRSDVFHADIDAFIRAVLLQTVNGRFGVL
jgi:hypothetical protein